MFDFIANLNFLQVYVLGSSLREADLGILEPTNLSLSPLRARKAGHKPLVVRATYSDDGRAGLSSAGIFIGGFILGGLAVGTLSCVYAPQISKALAGVDKKDLMRKLPKFIYDEDKALEKTRTTLTQKIDELNSAIDDASTQLSSGKAPMKSN